MFYIRLLVYTIRILLKADVFLLKLCLDWPSRLIPWLSWHICADLSCNAHLSLILHAL